METSDLINISVFCCFLSNLKILINDKIILNTSKLTVFVQLINNIIIRKDSSGEQVMGQREGFAQSDLLRINRRYCGGQNPVSLGPSGPVGGDRNPSYIDYIDNGVPPNYPNYGGGYPIYPQGPPFGGPPNNQFPPPIPPNNAYPPQNPNPRPPRPFRPIFGGIFG